MNNYFEVGVRYCKIMEDGTDRNVTEQYLLDAVSFTEAEARITKLLAPYISREYQVVTEKIAKVEQIVATHGYGDRFFKLKYNIITLDEKSGRVKRHPKYIIIEAESVDEARDRYQDYIKGWMADTELVSVNETKYVDYFPWP
ncbi:MAG: DUF4494 domain-containing protein [Bacteroidales bacterium]|nr:DUF4494 domain-containing protein [Bacteroidales bacterium]